MITPIKSFKTYRQSTSPGLSTSFGRVSSPTSRIKTSRDTDINFCRPHLNPQIVIRSSGSNKTLESARQLKLKIAVVKEKHRIGREYRKPQQNLSMSQIRTRSKMTSIADERGVVTAREQQIEEQHSKMKSRVGYIDTIKNNIVTQKSNEQIPHSGIQSFGASTFKGVSNHINSHNIAASLGHIKNFMLLESIDGTFSADFIKQKYQLQLLKTNLRLKEGQNQSIYGDEILEQSIIEAYQSVQNQLSKHQLQKHDNSGCSLCSVVISDSTVFASNCGVSSVYCLTTTNQLLKISSKHHTENTKEIERIVKNGGTVYRTTINIPYRQEMAVKGPLRVYPSGLTQTRTLGKAFDMKKQQQNKSILSEKVPIEFAKPKGILNSPQIQYINSKEVRWLAILSSSLEEVVSIEKVRQIIDNQSKYFSQKQTEHHIAAECTRRIITEGLAQGAKQSLSAIVVFMNNNFEKIAAERSNMQILSSVSSNKDVSQVSLGRPKSLKYIGKRKNFVVEE